MHTPRDRHCQAKQHFLSGPRYLLALHVTWVYSKHTQTHVHMETKTPERERNSNSKNKRRKRSSQQDSKRDVCSSRELPGKGKQAEERGRKGLGERKGNSCSPVGYTD